MNETRRQHIERLKVDIRRMIDYINSQGESPYSILVQDMKVAICEVAVEREPKRIYAATQIKSGRSTLGKFCDLGEQLK